LESDGKPSEMPEASFRTKAVSAMPIKAVESLLQEAIQRGDFDDLPGKGQHIDLSDYFNTPEDLRLAYSILKSADVLPEEVELLREVAALKEELALCSDEARRKQLHKAMEERMLKFNVMMDGRKRK
jgi:hypothetical protein